jgi:predicted HD phosphohydrolase
MSEGTKQDYEILNAAFESHTKAALVPNLIGMLDLLKGPTLGYQIDRYQHSLQSATRALRNDERPDLVVGALLHDVADGFAPENHSDAAATMLAPYVDAETHWVIKHHGIFQGYYYFHHLGGDRNSRERYLDEPHFDACVRFCERYDQNCFDPDYDTLGIETFIPLMEEVFSRSSQLPGIAPSTAGEDHTTIEQHKGNPS